MSVPEPHDPFVAGELAWRQYDPDALELPANGADDLAGRPGIYRKAAAVWRTMTDRHRREAACCYYASITEIDALFGRLLEGLERMGALERTVVVLIADHGELLGAHGLYCKNLGAWEEVYGIPMVVSGPGVARGRVSGSRVGLHDLFPTILDLAGLPYPGGLDGESFAGVLRDPEKPGSSREDGFAEYFGTRYLLTQRILWQGDWKYVLNGFDFDEMYDLARDPHEMHNLAEDPSCRERAHAMAVALWDKVRQSGDTSLLHTDYPILRLARVGPSER